jgi:hypothetical protein
MDTLKNQAETVRGGAAEARESMMDGMNPEKEGHLQDDHRNRPRDSLPHGLSSICRPHRSYKNGNDPDKNHDHCAEHEVRNNLLAWRQYSCYWVHS